MLIHDLPLYPAEDHIAEAVLGGKIKRWRDMEPALERRGGPFRAASELSPTRRIGRTNQRRLTSRPCCGRARCQGPGIDEKGEQLCRTEESSIAAQMAIPGF